MENQNTLKTRYSNRLPHWDAIISEWERSDLTKFKFCKENKITPSGFYLWHKKLRGESSNMLSPTPETKPKQFVSADTTKFIVNPPKYRCRLD